MASTSQAYPSVPNGYTPPDIPGRSVDVLQKFITTLPTEPAEQLSLIDRVLQGATPVVKDPVVTLVKLLVKELPLVCGEEEFHALMEGQGHASRVPFQLSEERAVPIYQIYGEMMALGPSRYRDLFDFELQGIAARVGCAGVREDGTPLCSEATLECLSKLISHVLVPVQDIFVSQKACAYMFGAVLYRMGMRVVGKAPHFSLRPIRPVDVELRDQHAYLAMRYTDEQLLKYGVSPASVRHLRRQACYVFSDQWEEVLARMELARSRYVGAMKGREEGAGSLVGEARRLDEFVMERSLEGVELKAENYIRERETILVAKKQFEPVRSPSRSQVISMFWGLVGTFLPLTQALRQALPFWLIVNKRHVSLQAAHVDFCLKSLAVLKEQDLSRNGVRQLTGTPLYILPFDALLTLVRGVHRLHQSVASDLGLPAPKELSEIPEWPKPEWLARYGYTPALAKRELRKK